MHAEMEYKQNICTPTSTHLSSLQKLKDPYIGTFMNKPGDDSPKHLKFKCKNRPISTSHPTSNAKPNFTFEVGRGTCLQSSMICHSLLLLRFEEINKFNFFSRTKFDNSVGTTGPFPQLTHTTKIQPEDGYWPKRCTNFFFELSCVRQLGKRASGPAEHQNRIVKLQKASRFLSNSTILKTYLMTKPAH